MIVIFLIVPVYSDSIKTYQHPRSTILMPREGSVSACITRRCPLWSN